MKGLLEKIYENVISKEAESMKLDRKFDAEVEKAVASLLESLDETQVEQVKEMIYEISRLAEKQGFYCGIKATVQVISEVVKITE